MVGAEALPFMPVYWAISLLPARPLPVYSTVGYLNDPALLNTSRLLPVHYSGVSYYWNSTVNKAAQCRVGVVAPIPLT